MKTLIAVDPGKGGGIAVLDREGVHLHNMPESLADICAQLREYGAATVILEEVPKYCGGKRPESTTFVLAQNLGRIEGIVTAIGYPLVRVHPKAWQKTFSISRDKQKSDAWKRRLKALACELFPHLDVTLKTADALLLLEHARRNNL